MVKYIAYTIIILSSFILSYNARNFNIQNRVTHADEAEQATTSIELIDNDFYQYNPNGPHGATLYYWADFISVDDCDTADIEDFRTTLNLIALAIILSIILSGRYLGKAQAFLAATCFALTTLFTIYSGYFVHEIIFALLVFLTAVSSWRFVCTPTSINALILGSFIGLTQATKETSLIAFASIFLSMVICAIFEKPLSENLKYILFTKNILKFASCAILSSLLFMTLFYSSFFSNLKGLNDAIYAYTHFFAKSTANEFSAGFFYYIKLLTLQKSQGVYFGELPLTILSIIGLCCAIISRKASAYKSTFAIYLFCNGLISLFILSLITYKTPWLILSPIVFFSITAGVGINYILSYKNKIVAIIGFIFVLVLGYYQYSLNQKATKYYNSDSRNPFIFSHTLKDYNNMINRIEDASKLSEYQLDIPIAFISKNSQWPAPFHLRNYNNVGYWADGSMPENIDVFQIIVCDFSTIDKVDKKIDKSKYNIEYFGLRENLMLTFFIKKDICDY